MAIGADTSTIEFGNNSFGLSIVYGVRCGFANAICASKEQFYLARWYKLGAELMNERLTTDRVNRFTVNRDEAKELKAEYDLQAQEALSNAIKGINLDESDCCIDCDFPIMLKEANNFY
jgi:hypothetical protein